MEPSDNSECKRQDFLRWQKIKLRVHEYQLEEAWKRLTDAGFKPLLIKGWSAAQYYDEPSERRFNDLDLAFAPEDFKSVEVFLEKEVKSLTIDTHNGLKHLDTQSFEKLFANSRIVKCGKTDIRVLSQEDHLRVLCVHWLIDGGAKKDKLWDIYYAVKNRPSDFDWDECLSVVSQVRQRWIICTIGLTHKYLGLDVSDTPIAESIKDLPEWLIKAVEKEWESDTVIVPLHFLLNDWKSFIKQLKKRIPPNPIQATVEMEGDFDKYPRFVYQIKNFFYRTFPFISRILKRLKN